MSGQLPRGGEALVAGAAAATAVGDTVRTCGVPRHPDEERSVVAVVGRPPVLRLGHQRIDVLRQGFEVEALELLGVVELLAVGISLGGVLAEDPQVQLVRPPVLVRCAANGLVSGAHHRALALFACHILSNRVLHFFFKYIRQPWKISKTWVVSFFEGFLIPVLGATRSQAARLFN